MLENLKIFLFKDKFGNHISKYKSFLLSSVFQPIFNHNNNIVGVEALLRIKDVSGESICPGFYFYRLKSGQRR